MKKITATLSKFVRSECPNYDPYYNGCLFCWAGCRNDADCLGYIDLSHTFCKVSQNKRCGFFEVAVLGPPDYPYRVPGYDYQKIFTQYGRINPAFAGRGVVVRLCECGAVLGPGRRVCDRCQKQHRKESNRRAIKKYREKQLSVSS